MVNLLKHSNTSNNNNNNNNNNNSENLYSATFHGT